MTRTRTRKNVKHQKIQTHDTQNMKQTKSGVSRTETTATKLNKSFKSTKEMQNTVSHAVRRNDTESNHFENGKRREKENENPKPRCTQSSLNRNVMMKTF